METNLTTTPVLVPAESLVAKPEMQKETVQPVAGSDRIKTIDLIRGVALLGILLMNIPGFGIHWTAFYNIMRGPHNTADFYTMTTVEMLFSGTMRGLFSMLFGAGMVLFTLNKKEVPGGPTVGELYYRRLLFLTAFGLFNAFVLLWWGDILYMYGLAGMVLYPFRKTAAKWLFVLGFVCIGIGIFKNQLNYNETKEKRTAYLEAVTAEKAGHQLTAEQQAAKAAWLERQNWKPDADQTKKDIQEVQGNFVSVWQHYLPQNTDIETMGLYHWVWDMLCMMFIGMGLLAIGFFSNKLSTSSYVMGLVLGYGIGIPIGWFLVYKGMLPTVDIASFVDRYQMPPQALYDFKRLFLSLGHASLFMLIYRSRIVPWLMKGLANVGQMAFTNYLMQSLLCTLFFHGYGLGYYNKLSFHQLYYVVGCVWVFQMIFSVIWLRYFRFGPFEWAWRSLTYGKKQPMRVPLSP
ncbi:MAG TPA: DUF418 domain-containing protein [Flavisolibacter sp.]|nr:DUF418 domain-containing protein [Flavisolibacter sp.]